jgi:hypothetical protein
VTLDRLWELVDKHGVMSADLRGHWVSKPVWAQAAILKISPSILVKSL